MTTAEANALLATFFPARAPHFYGRFAIGNTRRSMDEGARLILDGTKTTTSSLPGDYPDGNIPFVHALSVLEDGLGQARAIVETVRVATLPFGQIPARFAELYGEGDRTLDWFRTHMHAWYLARDPQFGGASPVICEWFQVVRRLEPTSL